MSSDGHGPLTSKSALSLLPVLGLFCAYLLFAADASRADTPPGSDSNAFDLAPLPTATASPTVTGAASEPPSASADATSILETEQSVPAPSELSTDPPTGDDAKSSSGLTVAFIVNGSTSNMDHVGYLVTPTSASTASSLTFASCTTFILCSTAQGTVFGTAAHCKSQPYSGRSRYVLVRDTISTQTLASLLSSGPPITFDGTLFTLADETRTLLLDAFQDGTGGQTINDGITLMKSSQHLDNPTRWEMAADTPNNIARAGDSQIYARAFGYGLDVPGQVKTRKEGWLRFVENSPSTINTDIAITSVGLSRWAPSSEGGNSSPLTCAKRGDSGGPIAMGTKLYGVFYKYPEVDANVASCDAAWRGTYFNISGNNRSGEPDRIQPWIVRNANEMVAGCVPDADGDGVPDYNDACPNDASKTSPGSCGCGNDETDNDGDGTPDCVDGCPADWEKTEPGVCGCGVSDGDFNNNGIIDCLETPPPSDPAGPGGSTGPTGPSGGTGPGGSSGPSGSTGSTGSSGPPSGAENSPGPLGLYQSSPSDGCSSTAQVYWDAAENGFYYTLFHATNLSADGLSLANYDFATAREKLPAIGDLLEWTDSGLAAGNHYYQVLVRPVGLSESDTSAIVANPALCRSDPRCNLSNILPISAAASWTATNLNGAPSARSGHTVIWTGSRMIVWGGMDNGGLTNSGSSYDPVANSWSPISTAGAPSPRAGHSAVWTDSEMLIWGGRIGSQSGDVSDTGAIYNPANNTWTSMTTFSAPAARERHSAVWTGTSMIICGGVGVNGVGEFPNLRCKQYTPSGFSGSWSSIPSTGQPTNRDYHSATYAWAGGTPAMLIWGGYSAATPFEQSGAAYSTSRTWSSISAVGAPSGRYAHTAVWTGLATIVWGGGSEGSYERSGSTFNLATNSWNAITTANAPSGRAHHTAVWTGSSMIVWGGAAAGTPMDSGGVYDAGSDTWSPTSTNNAPAARFGHTAIWTGSKMIVWGGSGASGRLQSGGIFDPSAPECNPGGSSSPSPSPSLSPSPDPSPSPSPESSSGQCGTEIGAKCADNAGGAADTPDPTPSPSASAEPSETPFVPTDPFSAEICGEGVPETDTDGDGLLDCIDGCLSDPTKASPGICGCGSEDSDSDSDGEADCADECSTDALKSSAAICGCGVSDIDSDDDSVADCSDFCPTDPNKLFDGQCGCGIPDSESDGDLVPDCLDECPMDPNKTQPGVCGCGGLDSDLDGDGALDCLL